MLKRHKKKYVILAEKGSKVEVKIEAKIENLDKADLEEILHKFASFTHNFYLSLGNKINDSVSNKP